MLEKTTKQKAISLWADISEQESADVYRLAKSLGMTKQGWLGQLIRRELSSSALTPIQPTPQTYLTGTVIKEGS